MALNLLKNNVPKKGNVVLVVVIIIAVAAISTGVGYWLARAKNKPIAYFNSAVVSQPTGSYALSSVIPVPAPAVTPTQPIVQPTSLTTSTKDLLPMATTTLPQEIVELIQWHDPQRIDRLGLYLGEDQAIAKNPGIADYSYKYYEVGNFVYQNISGRVLAAMGQSEDMEGAPIYVFIELNKQYTLVPKFGSVDNSDYYSSLEEELRSDHLDFAKFTVDASLKNPSPSFPDQIDGPKPRQILIRQSIDYFNLSMSGAVLKSSTQLGFSSAQWGDIYISTTTGGFYIFGPGQIFTGVYALQLDFFDKDGLVPQITWNDGTKNTQEYKYTTITGCGSTNLINVVSASDVNVAKDLVAVGKNNKGDLVYKLKDNNHPRLKLFYDTYVNTKEINYEEFLTSAQHPLLYWVDPFGRLIELRNTKYQPMAECGKPVIYLYPTSTMEVNVVVSPMGGLTYTDPPMGLGWSVTANPNGQLVETKTGRNYPYLFWEGRGGIYEQPKNGFVVKKSEVSGFLSAKLKLLGLNKKEISDFKEFWLPRMNEKPYYFITFLGNRSMDYLAPLTVDPAPNTVIRILMDYTPLDKPIKVNSFKFPRTPARKGFTVVEWGGVLR